MSTMHDTQQREVSKFYFDVKSIKIETIWTIHATSKKNNSNSDKRYCMEHSLFYFEEGYYETKCIVKLF